jgi:ATP-dependent DNA helicase RecG
VTAAITFNDLAARPVADIKGIGPKKLAGLAEMGVASVADLIAYYPRRWLDRTNEARIRDLVIGQEALVLVDIRGVTKRLTKQRKTMITARVGDGSGQLSVVFFNQPWREKQLREGMTVALFGKADTFQGGLQMTNPIVDVIGDRTGRIVPIYPQSEKSGLATWEIAGWVESALNRSGAHLGLGTVRPHRSPDGVVQHPSARDHGRQGEGTSSPRV